MKIFGREPALIISAFGALVTLLVSLNIPGLSAGAGAALTSLVTALVVAFTTRPVAPALFVAVVAPAAALAAEYRFHVADNVVSAIPAVILVVFALFGIRPQVSPVSGER